MSESIRERVIRLIREMQNRTIDRGCTPAEAAAFSAKIAEWIEKYQIEEAELRAQAGTGNSDADIEVCQNKLRTGQKVFNPGRTAIVSALARAMCCKVILLSEWNSEGKFSEAVYGVVGDTLDADYVCQMAVTLVPSLQTMARLEGIEHGYEKAGLIRWTNQYLMGAAVEIQKRIEADRKERSAVKEMEAKLLGNSYRSGALVVVTGESLAVFKRAASLEAFKELYPKTKTHQSRASYDHTAYEQGKKAGKRVGLNISIE